LPDDASRWKVYTENIILNNYLPGGKIMRKQTSMKTGLDLNINKLVVPGVVMLAFLTLGTVIWQSTGEIMGLFFFGYIGLSVGVGLGLYAALPKKKKPLGRRLSLILVGTFLIVFAAIYGEENMQLEGVFFGLLGGVFQAAVVHYLIAKIFGPMLFGRIWCGWACWTVMVLDLLPFKRPAGRVPGKWGWIRYLHFVFSLGLVAFAWYGLGFTEGAMGKTALAWYITGNLAYYVVGIVLAYALKDNRAFCKYVCPVAVPLKITSRFALLKIGGEAEKCNDCQACVKMCPMDIRIPEYIQDGKRVLSTECSLCQTCITVCAKDALKLSFGFDLGGKDLLRERPAIIERKVRHEKVTV
jgi:polyferredoxin